MFGALSGPLPGFLVLSKMVTSFPLFLFLSSISLVITRALLTIKFLFVKPLSNCCWRVAQLKSWANEVHVCSPLGVVPKRNGNLRLVLDL